MINSKQKEEKKKIQKSWNSSRLVQEVLGVFDDNER